MCDLAVGSCIRPTDSTEDSKWGSSEQNVYERAKKVLDAHTVRLGKV
jgi:hypothetical protein